MFSYNEYDFGYNAVIAREAKYDLVIHSDTFNDIINALSSINKQDCIKTIVFGGHGSPYGIWVGSKYPRDPKTGNRLQAAGKDVINPIVESGTLKDNYISRSNKSFFAQKLLKSVVFCKDPVIYLYGCNTGLTAKNKTKSWVQEFANELNAVLYGTAGYSNLDQEILGNPIHNVTETIDTVPAIPNENGKFPRTYVGPYKETDDIHPSKTTDEGFYIFTPKQ